ncbi:MAG: DUF2786 domain-containing protein [Acidimicrobiales bacterium]
MKGPDNRTGTLGAEAIRGLLSLASEPPNATDPVTVQCIDALSGASADVVDQETETVLIAVVAQLWTTGWQPFELQRQGRLGCANGAGARLVSAAIANDHALRRSVTLHPRWVAQVEGLELPPADGRPGWIGRWIVDEGCDRLQAVTTMVDAMINLRHLPRLEPILPSPGSGDQPPSAPSYATYGGPAGADSNPVLQRIRNLLAKAESTTFEAEAMAFTAKAQELMTRHAIDAALVHGGDRASGEQPVAIRLPIDPPYAESKSLLLQTIAAAGRCRAVRLPDVLLSTVVGYANDIAAVEMLFTSLLVQAQTAMADAAKRAPAGSRPRSQAFRSAFLAGYTSRIGARLREINEAVYAEVEAEQGAAFLPVLRSRTEAVDDFVAELFGELKYTSRNHYLDAAGWASGTVAADNAKLSAGEVRSR